MKMPIAENDASNNIQQSLKSISSNSESADPKNVFAEVFNEDIDIVEDNNKINIIND